MKRRWVVCLAFVTTIAQTMATAEEMGPAKEIPELQVLQHYAGTWDVALTGDGAGKGEATAKWILGGRFLEQSGVLKAPDRPAIWITSLFTFDTEKQKYLVWTFASNGSISEAEMSWDADSKIMTSVSQPDASGIRATNKADFSKPGTERWHFRYTDRAGKQVGEMSGENRLRKGVNNKPTLVVDAKSNLERSAEDRKLDAFLGTWKAQYRVPKAEWIPEEQNGSARMVFTLELNGKMVRERTQHADGAENTFLMLYDAAQKQYRAWWFNSLGMFNQSTGQWNEATKAFTWTRGEPNGRTDTAQHRFVDNRLDWTVVIQNQQRLTLFRMEGTSQRVSESK